MRRPISQLTLATLSLLAFASSGMQPAQAAPVCTTLATDPANGLAGTPGIKTATSAVVPAAGTNAAYCLVSILYGTNPNQNINIWVGLPLSASDGGSGRLQGAWNGRTQGLGGGGCAGVQSPNQLRPTVTTGYAASGTDTGHTGGNCEPGVNANGTYNLQFINDFIRDGIKQQILLSKSVARTYYGIQAVYNYWNGCSTAGRQGYLLAQELGNELEGILGIAPAIYWTRFQTAQMWGQIVMKQLTGGPISSAKLTQTTASAVQACDASDGATDGIIDDPRTCTFSAKTNICGSPNAPATNCLTAAEAEAIDKIWDGPRNRKGNKIWFGLDRGTNLSGLNGTNAFALGVTQFHWDEHDLNFDWHTVSMEQYSQVAEDGSKNIADVTDTFAPLDQFKAHGGKLLTWVGGNDQLIFPRGVINYYRQMAAHYGQGGKPDFTNLQNFYRLFRAPGVGHCGGGGPTPVDAFGALVNWVENKIPPQSLLAASGSRTRPLCPYPQTAIYSGAGSIDAASSFTCGGNLETQETVCSNVLTRYKHEVQGTLDFSGSGFTPGLCRVKEASGQ